MVITVQRGSLGSAVTVPPCWYTVWRAERRTRGRADERACSRLLPGPVGRYRANVRFPFTEYACNPAGSTSTL